MAHFAKINSSNIVERVDVVNNDVIQDNGAESESKGIAFLKQLYGQDTNWVQTSYNGNFRKNFAGKDFTWDPVNEVFIQPQPYPSWSLDSNFEWQPPISRPDNGFLVWDEENQTWIEKFK
jgi:hypothetical protein